MLLSKMPWHTVQYSSPLPCIKFLTEEWHFKSKPIAVLMNQQGNMKTKNGLHLIRQRGFMALPFTRHVKTPYAFAPANPPGPYQDQEYTFYYGGKDQAWIDRFSEIVNSVANHPDIQNASIYIYFACVGKSSSWKRNSLCNQEIENLLLPLRKENTWAVLIEGSAEVIDCGPTILNVLEAFGRWKGNLKTKKSFGICFKEHHDRYKHHQTHSRQRIS